MLLFPGSTVGYSLGIRDCPIRVETGYFQPHLSWPLCLEHRLEGDMVISCDAWVLNVSLIADDQ